MAKGEELYSITQLIQELFLHFFFVKRDRFTGTRSWGTTLDEDKEDNGGHMKNSEFFEEVLKRIQAVTHTSTQVELAEILEIRQSSISEAKKRNSIPPDWYMKLFEKLGINPDWLKKGVGPTCLRTEAGYGPSELNALDADGTNEGDSLVRYVLATTYSTRCTQEDDTVPPSPVILGKMVLPQAYVGPNISVLSIDTDSFAPTIRKGAYVGVDTASAHPVSGEIFAVFMPHEGVALKRLFYDGAQSCFVLRTENAAYPEYAFPPEECSQRLMGRVIWVLQTF